MRMSRRRIIWLLLSLFSIVAISYYGGVISYSFFYACILLPVISGAYLFYVNMRFSIYQQIDTRNIVCGQAVPYSFILQNEDITVYTGISVRLYSSYSNVENLEDNKQYRLFPGARIQIDTKLTCKYRGEYDVGVKEIIVYDFFGLFRARYKIPSVIRALVTPRIVGINELRSLPQLIAMLEMESVHDKTEPDIVVRDYVTGDSMRKIHWKSTARQQSLKVRNQIGNEKQRIAVLFDAERVSGEMAVYLPLENKILETTIALLHYFVHQNTELRLIWGTGSEKLSLEKRDVVNLKHFEQTFRELSAISFVNGFQAEAAIQEAWQKRLLSSSSIIFMVLHGLSPGLYALAQQLVKEDKIIVLYVVTREDISEYIKQSSMRLHIVAIDPEQELSEVL